MIFYYRSYRKSILIVFSTAIAFIMISFFQLQVHIFNTSKSSTLIFFPWSDAFLQEEDDETADAARGTADVSHSSCVVVFKTSEGRLGNLMFKFASAYGIAKSHACSLHLGRSILKNLTPIFNIRLSNQIDTKTLNSLLKHRTLVTKHSDCKFFFDLKTPNAVHYLEIQGYWQGFGHFLKYLDELRHQFTFKENIVRAILPFLKRYTADQNETILETEFHNLKKYVSTTSMVRWIGIHIRRGDFLSKDSVSFGHTISSPNYINRAMDYFNDRYINRTLFFVSSDDKAYCEQLFNEITNVHITPKHYSPAEDLAVLSLCHDTIITGGTFGWWAGILAGGTVVHDINYPQNGSRLEAVCPRSSYFPPWFLFM